jgi:hypothetical protein
MGKDIRNAAGDLERIADNLTRGGNAKDAARDLERVERSYGLRAALGARFGARAEADVKRALDTVRSLSSNDSPVRRATAITFINGSAARARS